jgi:hypothetical protein
MAVILGRPGGQRALALQNRDPPPPNWNRDPPPEWNRVPGTKSNPVPAGNLPVLEHGPVEQQSNGDGEEHAREKERTRAGGGGGGRRWRCLVTMFLWRSKRRKHGMWGKPKSPSRGNKRTHHSEAMAREDGSRSSTKSYSGLVFRSFSADGGMGVCFCSSRGRETCQTWVVIGS